MFLTCSWRDLFLRAHIDPVRLDEMIHERCLSIMVPCPSWVLKCCYYYVLWVADHWCIYPCEQTKKTLACFSMEDNSRQCIGKGFSIEIRMNLRWSASEVFCSHTSWSVKASNIFIRILWSHLVSSDGSEALWIQISVTTLIHWVIVPLHLCFLICEMDIIPSPVLLRR